MSLRVLAIFGLMVSSSLAHAQNSFGRFDWQRNGNFTFQFYSNGTASELKGFLQEDPGGKAVEVQVTENGFNLNLKVFPEGFAYAFISQDFDDKASVYLMERVNGFYVSMNADAIAARKITVVTDMTRILEDLLRLNGWDISLSMRAMKQYFTENPAHQFSEFDAAIQNGYITQNYIKPSVPSVEGGVVTMPDLPTRPPKIDIDEPAPEQPAVEQPVEVQPEVQQPGTYDGDDDQAAPTEPLDLTGGDIFTTPEDPPRPPQDIPGNNDNGNDGGFVPLDMTDGWDGDEGGVQQPSSDDWLAQERAKQREERRKRRNLDDDLD